MPSNLDSWMHIISAPLSLQGMALSLRLIASSVTMLTTVDRRSQSLSQGRTAEPTTMVDLHLPR
jgi:hypothetical protein